MNSYELHRDGDFRYPIKEQKEEQFSACSLLIFSLSHGSVIILCGLKIYFKIFQYYFFYIIFGRETSLIDGDGSKGR